MEREGREASERRYGKLKTEIKSLRNDIAKLKKEKKALEKALANKERLFHSAPAGILVVQQEKIVEINGIALDQLGYRPEEVIGRNFLDFVHPGQRTLLKEIHKNRASGKVAPDQYDAKLLTRDGAARWCDVRVSKVRYNGRVAFVATLSALGWRKEKEKAALQSGKMEAIITMALGLIDEYGRCIATISENSKKLRAIFRSEDAVVTCLRDIDQASDKALLMTEKLACLAGRENEQNEMVSFDLKEVIKDAAATATREWEKARDENGSPINIKTYLRPVPQLNGDLDEIREALTNIIMNAIHAMPQGGDILITTEGNAGYAHIYVQDSGDGISDDAKDRIFDPFYTANGRGGTGLGLSLSYAIIKRHGGEIDVSSQKDQGTTFDIKLPVSRTKAGSGNSPSRKRIKEANILIIEGDDFTCELLSQLLKSKGCSVVSANSVPEGIGRLRKKRFDLLISEAPPPELHEANFLRKIRKIDRQLSVAFIRRPGDGNGSSSRRRSAADLTIWKPVDLNKAVKEITALLTGGN